MWSVDSRCECAWAFIFSPLHKSSGKFLTHYFAHLIGNLLSFSDDSMIDTNWHIQVFSFSNKEVRATLGTDGVVRDAGNELTQTDHTREIVSTLGPRGRTRG